MRKALLTSIFLAGSAIAASPALADDAAAAPAPTPEFTITGAADVSSQYRFRGISQSDNKAVFQGTFTISHASGFYLSTWGSSASSDSWVNIGGTEIDVYAGYTHTFKNGFTVDGGLYGYLYPGSSHAVGISENYFEVYGDASKTVGPVTAKVGVNWAPHQSYFNNFNTPTGYNMYVYGELGFAVPNSGFSIHSHLGHTGGGFDYVGHQYLDYTVGASYKWKSLTFDISVVGTNISKRDAADYTGLSYDTYKTPYRDARAVPVGTITASF